MAKCLSRMLKVLGLISITHKQGAVAHSCNPTTCEVEAGELEVKVILGYKAMMRPSGLHETVSEQQQQQNTTQSIS